MLVGEWRPCLSQPLISAGDFCSIQCLLGDELHDVFLVIVLSRMWLDLRDWGTGCEAVSRQFEWRTCRIYVFARQRCGRTKLCRGESQHLTPGQHPTTSNENSISLSSTINLTMQISSPHAAHHFKRFRASAQPKRHVNLPSMNINRQRNENKLLER